MSFPFALLVLSMTCGGVGGGPFPCRLLAPFLSFLFPFSLSFCALFLLLTYWGNLRLLGSISIFEFLRFLLLRLASLTSLIGTPCRQNTLSFRPPSRLPFLSCGSTSFATIEGCCNVLTTDLLLRGQIIRNADDPLLLTTAFDSER